MGEAGLQGVEHTRNFATIFGTVALYCAPRVP
jgi:hypothetical protein